MKFFPFQFCIVENIRFEFPTWVNELEFQTMEPITRLFLNNTPYTLQICCTFQAHKHSSYYLLIFKRINIGRKDEGEKRSIISFRSSFFDLSLDRYRRREEIPKRLPRKVSPVGYWFKGIANPWPLTHASALSISISNCENNRSRSQLETRPN